jgi:putative endonuclease
MDTHRIGRRFEDVAAAWLEARGWRIIERNVRFGRKEVDLVMRRGDLVAFVEVKGRRSARYGHPLEAITPRKRREIELVASWWLARADDPELRCRFDAVAVTRGAGGRLEVDHVEDAWRPGWA